MELEGTPQGYNRSRDHSQDREDSQDVSPYSGLDESQSRVISEERRAKLREIEVSKTGNSDGYVFGKWLKLFEMP